MSNEIEITVCGWVAKHPTLVERPGGMQVLNVRIGSTPRRRDAAGTWGDGPTQWFNVVAFRDLAVNAAFSLHKGDPVLVRGRLAHVQWEHDGRAFAQNEITAEAIGHDLSRGRAMFTRTVRRSGAAEPEALREPTPEEIDALEAGLDGFVELAPRAARGERPDEVGGDGSVPARSSQGGDADDDVPGVRRPADGEAEREEWAAS